MKNISHIFRYGNLNPMDGPLRTANQLGTLEVAENNLVIELKGSYTCDEGQTFRITLAAPNCKATDIFKLFATKDRSTCHRKSQQESHHWNILTLNIVKPFHRYRPSLGSTFFQKSGRKLIEAPLYQNRAIGKTEIFSWAARFTARSKSKTSTCRLRACHGVNVTCKKTMKYAVHLLFMVTHKRVNAHVRTYFPCEWIIRMFQPKLLWTKQSKTLGWG